MKRNGRMGERGNGRWMRMLAGIFACILAGHAACDEAHPTEREMAKQRELFDSGVPRNASEELASYYVQAAQRMKEMILHPKGTTQAAREFRQARAAEQIQQVDRLLSELRTRTAAWLGDKRLKSGKVIPGTMTALVAEARARADKQAIEAGVRIEKVQEGHATVQGSFSLIDARRAEVFARDLYGDLDKAARSMGDRAKGLLRQTAQEGLAEADINRVLAVGSIEGKPMETIRRLKKELEAVHGGKVKIIDKNGDPMEFDVGYYAEMVVRTKTREAAEVARHERLAELDLASVARAPRMRRSAAAAGSAEGKGAGSSRPASPVLLERSEQG